MLRRTHQLLTLLMQVDALWPGFLGQDRVAFSHRYCSRRLVPVKGRGGSNTQRWDNSGLSCAGELHAMLKQVGRHGSCEVAGLDRSCS